MQRSPKSIVRTIREAIAKAKKENWPDLHVQLQWADYKVLMAARGINWEPSKHPDTVGYYHDDRPITTFDGLPLDITTNASVVMSRPPGGLLQGWAIVEKEAP